MKNLYTVRGNEILYSPCDYELLSTYTWCENKRVRPDNGVKETNRLMRRFTVNGKRVTQGIGVCILGNQYEAVDHINGNVFDNRRENLRGCTKQENCFNRRRRGTISGYKGIYWDKNKSRYRTTVWLNGKCYYAGYFKTIYESLLGYNKLATELHGEFARLHKIPKDLNGGKSR